MRSRSDTKVEAAPAPAPPPRAISARSRALSDTAVAWLMLAPALAAIVLFTHLPAALAMVESLFSQPSRFRPAAFVGAGNYVTLFGDPVFRKALVNNLIFALFTIPLSIVLALVMALYANAAVPGRWFLRLSYFAPTVLPMIAVANIWLFFYTPGYGLLDSVTALFGLAPHNWLGMPGTALPAVMAISIWKEAGFFMIFYLAGLQQIPPDLIDVARLEGAGRWTRLRRVVLPLLMPTTVFVLINATINAVRLVDHIIVITKGGPNNATMLLFAYLYNQGFLTWNLPMAAAVSVVILSILGIVGGLQFALLNRRTHYR